MKVKKNARVKALDPSKQLKDENFIAKVIWECLSKNDPAGAMEAISVHLEMVNKSKMCEDKELSRSTLYSSLKGRNPTIKTLAKIISSVS